VKAVFPFEHRSRRFTVRLTDDRALELLLGDVVRKRREAGIEPQYVWTNVELEWEEHHYVEARYWASEDRLRITINREPLHDGPLVAAH
jgi:hypothetical protein